jgi:hypothetical protein
MISKLRTLTINLKSLLKQGVSSLRLAVGLTLGELMGIIPI